MGAVPPRPWEVRLRDGCRQPRSAPAWLLSQARPPGGQGQAPASPRRPGRGPAPGAQKTFGTAGWCAPAPSAPRLQLLETSESARNKGGAAFQRQTTNSFAFFFFFPPKRAVGQVGGPGGAWFVPGAPTTPALGRPRAHVQAGRRRPGPPAQPLSGQSPWQRARGGGAGRRGPRRLLFLPLPVPRGHVAMATMLLAAAASPHGWRA